MVTGDQLKNRAVIPAVFKEAIFDKWNGCGGGGKGGVGERMVEEIVLFFFIFIFAF